MNGNPLYDLAPLPEFDRIRPEHAEPAIRARLAEAAAAVSRLESAAAPTWEGLLEPLHRACEPLFDAWGVVGHLLSVMDSDGWRRAHDALQPEIVAFGLRVAQNPAFYRAYCALRDADRATPCLTGPRRRILESLLRDAEQAGVGLPEAARGRVEAIQQELAQRGTAFGHNLLDAIKAYGLWVRDPAGMEGAPPTVRSLAAQAAQAAGEAAATAEAGPWRLTLDAAVYVPFLLHASSRPLREQLYRAYVVRAAAPPHDNSGHVERILALRRELAGLLGYAAYADLSLSRKMAANVAAVDGLLGGLADAARPGAAAERGELAAFAAGRGFAEPALAPWDVPFWSERLREARYGYREEELRAYFQFPRVLEGLFALAERLFGIRVAAADGRAPVWHPDVRFFEVRDAGGATLAAFYLDPYSRPATKRGGAWFCPLRARDRRPDGAVRLPLGALACNQTPPADGRPSLMRFDEITTLFHEFGHALQHMLTTVDDADAAGIHNIEWDAVEIASQFMENWCWERGTLAGLSRHIETGAPLPDDLSGRLRAGRNHRAATDTLRQVFFGATDMDLHARYPRPEWPDANAVKDAAARRLLPVPLLPEDRLLCAFSHLFGGGYAAGYYSYKWSEVLSADAFAAFEEAGLGDEAAVRATGRRYRDTILALGGGTAPAEVFRAFRGRDPTIDALLRHRGLRPVQPPGVAPPGRSACSA
jgi:oligopeptidase A